MDKSSSLAMSPGHPNNIREAQASKLGDAQGTPSSSIKSTRSFFNTLYFYCFMQYVLFLEHLYFLLCVYCFEYSWTSSCLLWSETRPAVLHIYFGVRHTPLFCIMFTLE